MMRRDKTIYGHPLLAYRAMFDVSSAEICVFTGRADRDYMKDMLGAAVRFLSQPGRTLRLACQCGRATICDCDIVRGLVGAVGRLGRVIVYDSSRYHGMPYVMIADGRGYCHDQGDRAEINYGNESESARWQTDFDRIAAKSQVVIDTHEGNVQ